MEYRVEKFNLGNWERFPGIFDDDEYGLSEAAIACVLMEEEVPGIYRIVRVDQGNVVEIVDCPLEYK